MLGLRVSANNNEKKHFFRVQLIFLFKLKIEFLKNKKKRKFSSAAYVSLNSYEEKYIGKPIDYLTRQQKKTKFLSIKSFDHRYPCLEIETSIINSYILYRETKLIIFN